MQTFRRCKTLLSSSLRIWMIVFGWRCRPLTISGLVPPQRFSTLYSTFGDTPCNNILTMPLPVPPTQPPPPQQQHPLSLLFMKIVHSFNFFFYVVIWNFYLFWITFCLVIEIQMERFTPGLLVSFLLNWNRVIIKIIKCSQSFSIE